MYLYGRVYSKLSVDQIKSLEFGKNLNEKLLFLSKIYFFLFGYPDIASQMRYLIVEKLLHLKLNEKVLDAGCGNGIYLQEFSSKFDIDGFGVDIRKNRVASANRINKYLGRNDEFMASSLETVDLGRKKFDKAICLEVLEHIENDSGALKRLSKNLKKGAIFVISVPMKGTALTKEQEEDPNFKPKKFEHVRSGYDVSDIRVMAKKTGFKIVSIEKYFFLISRYMVKIQQYIYKKNYMFLNLLLSPLLLLISSLDNIIKIYPRGYMIVLKKI